jgi:hypothetical protein
MMLFKIIVQFAKFVDYYGYSLHRFNLFPVFLFSLTIFCQIVKLLTTSTVPLMGLILAAKYY